MDITAVYHTNYSCFYYCSLTVTGQLQHATLLHAVNGDSPLLHSRSLPYTRLHRLLAGVALILGAPTVYREMLLEFVVLSRREIKDRRDHLGLQVHRVPRGQEDLLGTLAKMGLEVCLVYQ